MLANQIHFLVTCTLTYVRLITGFCGVLASFVSAKFSQRRNETAKIGPGTHCKASGVLAIVCESGSIR